MMRAEAEGVDMGTVAAQFFVHPGGEILDRGDVIKTARHARLIADHENESAGIVAGFDGRLGALNPFKTIRAMRVACILVQHIVSIEEDGGAPECRRKLSARGVVIVRNADIDEVSLI